MSADTSSPPVIDESSLAVPAPRRRPRPSPLHLLAAGVAAAALWYSAGPLRDFDSFWHRDIGAQIVHLHRVHDLPVWWLGVPAPHAWTTSQWLAEAGMYAATSVGGWRAVLMVNVGLMLALIVSLWWILLRGRTPLLAVPVFLTTLVGAASAIQQRPQSISLILLPWLAVLCLRLMERSLPRVPAVLIAVACLLWAQVHGLWILAPAALVLTLIGIGIDGQQPRRPARIAAIALLASMAGVINPHGLGSFLLPFQFRAAAGTIAEWAPTTFGFSFTLCWAALLLLTVVAWSRTAALVPRSEVLWVVAWTAYGLQSYRNVTPALLLIAPFTLHALMRAADLQPQFQRWLEAQAKQSSRRESTVLIGAGAAILGIGVVLTGVRVATINPYSRAPGASIARWVAGQPAPMRVWAASTATMDTMIGLSDGKARLVADGRADLWGDPYLRGLIHAEALAPGWQQTLGSFHPDAVVIMRDSALASTLTGSGWRSPVHDQSYTLLLPPAGSGGVAGQ